MKNKILILIGRSGSGKSTIESLIDTTEHFSKATSFTTRAKRPYEGADAYHFITKEEFHRMFENNELVEHAAVYDDFYGLERKEFEPLNNGKDVVVVTEINGAHHLISEFGKENVCLCHIDTDFETIESRLSPVEFERVIKRKEVDDKIFSDLPVDIRYKNNRVSETPHLAVLDLFYTWKHKMSVED